MKKRFPDDFHYCGQPSAVHVSDETIQGFVSKVKKMLKKQEREDPDDYSPCYMATGDTVVIGFRNDDCKNIIVCRGYYEMGYAFKD